MDDEKVWQLPPAVICSWGEERVGGKNEGTGNGEGTCSHPFLIQKKELKNSSVFLLTPIKSSELNNKQGHECGLTVGPVLRDTGINFYALRGSQESTDRARGLTMFPIMSFIIPNMSMKPPDCSRE